MNKELAIIDEKLGAVEDTIQCYYNPNDPTEADALKDIFDEVESVRKYVVSLINTSVKPLAL